MILSLILQQIVAKILEDSSDEFLGFPGKAQKLIRAKIREFGEMVKDNDENEH